MVRSRKYTVVLTADQTLMSNYGSSLFFGFLSTAPRKRVSVLSPKVIERFVVTKVGTDESGMAQLAPHGLRRAEAAMVQSGVVSREDIAVAPPASVGSFISSETKIIGISAIDPLGRAPASSTFAGPYGAVHGEAINAYYFRKLITSEAIQGARKAGVVLMLGGPGAWQFGPAEMEKWGVDIVMEGEGELLIPQVVRSVLEGKVKLPARFIADHTMIPEVHQIPQLLGGTVGGVIEISRGCGRGCRFCMPTLRKIRHRPVEDVLRDVKTVVAAGQRSLTLHAEDFVRYGSMTIMPEHEKVMGLVKAVMGVPGVEFMCPSHAAMASIASSPKTVQEVSEILGLKKHNWLGFQTGIETGSFEIMQKFMNRKSAPFETSQWHEVVETAFGVCQDNNWIPAATLMINWPGETEKDVMQTVELLDKLIDYRSLIVPLLFVPMGNDTTKPMRLIEDANCAHWELYRAVWRHDTRWMDELTEDYSRHSAGLTKIAIRTMVRLINTLASPKANAYLEKKINSFKKLEVDSASGAASA
jgi:hypothetical protein